MFRCLPPLVLGLLAAPVLPAVLPEDNPGQPFAAILARLDELAGKLDDLAEAVSDAGDGVRQITMECVATGCFSGDTPGFPVEVTERGSYRLASDLMVATPNTTAVRIAADGVTFDLGGFEVAGPYECDTSGGFPFACATSGAGVGVHAVAPFGHSVVIRNGTIAGFDLSGVIVVGEGRVMDVSVRSCDRGIVLSRGSVHRVHVTDVARDAITSGAGSVADAFVLRAGTRGIVGAVVRDSVVFASGEVGIFADTAESNWVRRTGQAVASAGINCRLCIENNVRDAVGAGIAFEGTSQGNFLGNHVVGSTGFGIEANLFSVVAYGHNLLVGNNGGSANPQVGGTGTLLEVAPNVCGTDTVCP